MQKAKIISKAFLISIAINGFAFLSFNMSISGFPVYISSQGSDYITTGLVTSLSAVAALLIRPFAGYFINQFDVVKVLRFGLMLMSFSPIVCLSLNHVSISLIMRFIQGIGWGLSSTACSTMIANSLPLSRLSEGIGYSGLVSSVCSAFAPAFAVYLFEKHGAYLMLLCISISTLLPLILMTCKSDYGYENANTNFNKVIISDDFVKNAFIPSILAFFITISYSPIVTFVSQYVNQIKINPAFFFVSYAITTVIIRPLTGFYIDRYGYFMPSMLSIIFALMGLFMLYKCESAVELVLSAIFSGLSMGIGTNAFQSMAVAKVPPSKRGIAISVFLFGFKEN